MWTQTDDEPATVHHRWPAMGCEFELFLSGGGQDHLVAVGDAVRDEVRRLERMLSRFDPASDVARVNREAADRPVRVCPEVAELVSACERYSSRTHGTFNVTAGTRPQPGPAFTVDPKNVTIRLHTAATRLDLGAIGKGHALDRAAEVVGRFGVASALLNAGTSSLVAVGTDSNGEPWTIALRDPAGDALPPIGRVRLQNRSLSYSSVRHPGQPTSDVVNPSTGRPLVGNAACVVLAASATDAEILSTALLVMGRDRAAWYLERDGWDGASVAWIDAGRLEWLTEAP